MNKIALIGAGQLGSRHLQGVAKSNVDISIEVVEPFQESREAAKARYEEISENFRVKSISFFESIDELSEDLDMVIVATNADIRYQVVKELLTKKKVTNLVLEKVLFQKVNEYEEVKSLLEKRSVKCWVNHPRRMFPFYKNLKNEIKNSTQINYSVQGGAWGLACSGLHFIDHLSFLSEKNDVRLCFEGLDKKVYSTKRKNFAEFNGLLTGTMGNHKFSLFSHKETMPFTLCITTDTLTANIDEINGYTRIARKNNDWKWEESNEKIVHFQSELTNLLVDEIMTSGDCSLPTFNEAMNLHVPFIQALLEHMKSIDGKEYVTCPIT